MNREIRFRAWDKDQNIMLYDFDQNTPGVKLGQSIHLKVYETGLLYGTLMQYTGLLDKNGVEIYEGDIIKGVIILHDDPFSPNDNEIRLVDEVGQVKFLNGVFLLWNESEYDQGLISRYDDVEVLGNIYQNSQLLEVKGRKES